MRKSEIFWDKLADSYDNQDTDSDYIYRQTIENIKKHLTGNEAVLDFGCATGQVTFEIAGNVKNIHAIDISERMIQIAGNKASALQTENVEFTRSDIFDEKFRENSFDLILALNILHLLEDLGGIVQRFNTLLKPGGLIITSTPCLGKKKTIKIVLVSFLSRMRIFPYIIFFSVPELSKLITGKNFEIVEINNIQDKKDENLFIVAMKKRK